MRTRFLKLLLMLCLFNFPIAFSQSLDFESAYESAVANNPQFQAAKARLGVSEAEMVTAAAWLNPSLVSDNGVAEKTYRLGIEQVFELGGKRRHRVAVADAQRQIVVAEISTAMLNLRSDVRKAYTRLYNAELRHKALNDIVGTTDQLLSVAQKREHAGDIPQLDVLQAEVQKVRSSNDAQVAVSEAQRARASLNALLNHPVTTVWSLKPPSGFKVEPVNQKQSASPLQAQVRVTEFDLKYLTDLALDNRPELEQNQKGLELINRQTALARSNIVPDLRVAVGPDYVAETGQKNLNVFFIASVELPVFNRQQGPLQEAEARKEQLLKEKEALKNQIVLEVSNAYNAFLQNDAQVNRYEAELLPKAQEVADKSRRSFEVGKSNILLSLNAQQAYMQTTLDYLNALLDYQNSITDLERAIGTGL